MKQLNIGDVIIGTNYNGEDTKEFKVWWTSEKRCEATEQNSKKPINVKFNREIKSDGKIIPYPKSAFLNWLNYTFSLKQKI